MAVLLDNYAETEDKDGGLIANTLELVEAGKEASLPDEVIEFIIQQDITTVKKKRKTVLQSDDDTNKSASKSMASNIYAGLYAAFISNEITVPAIPYYKHKITRWTYLVVMHPLFNTTIMLIIVMNTIMLAFDRYPEPPDDQQFIFYIFNIVFTVIFGLEVLIKILALSIRGFLRDRFNIFDTLVVIISVIELNLESGSGSSLGALRAVRLFRIFKIFRVGDLRVLIDSIGTTVLGMGNYTVLLMLFIYLYALLGMQFFAGKFTFGDNGLFDTNGIVPRENFDTIWEAFVTIVIIMIGDGWNIVMYYGMLSEGKGFAIFFVTLYTFGNIIMINLFLAILLGNFNSSRQLMAKRKAFDEFKRLKRKKTPLPIALIIVLGDLGDYINSNVLEDESRFIDNISEANIPGNNIIPATSSQIKRNQEEEEVKFQATTMPKAENTDIVEFKTKKPKLFQTEKPAHERSKNNQDRESEEKDQNENENENENEEDDILYNSFGRSQESVDKLLQDTHPRRSSRTKLDSPIFNNAKMSSNKEIILPPISRISEMIHELPANQQEGEAYDKALPNNSSRQRELPNPDTIDENNLSKIKDQNESSDLEDSK